MCLIVLANNYHPKYKLVLAANRDEFYSRSTEPAHFWDDNPNLLAGKDLQAGGTWMGITKKGRYAAITNFRDPNSMIPKSVSRGTIVTDYLNGVESPKNFLENLMETAQKYNGFNLLVGNTNELYFFSNRTNDPEKLIPNIYGLSNHLLDTPWSKVVKSKQAFASAIEHKEVKIEKLFSLLSDTSVPPDDELPETGVGIEIERIAAPVFIESPTYGTRASTVLLIDKNNNVTFIEKSLDTDKKEWNKSEFNFKIE